MFFGSESEVSPQEAKAEAPIVVTESGKLITPSDVQPLKASLPILVIVSETITDPRYLLFLNASFPTAITVYPSMVLGTRMAEAEPLKPVIVALLSSSKV